MKIFFYICSVNKTKQNKNNIMNTLTKTFSELSIGTIVFYNDMANNNLEAIILDSYTDEFGNWINIMNVESRTIEPISAKTEIGLRWTEKELYI